MHTSVDCAVSQLTQVVLFCLKPSGNEDIMCFKIAPTASPYLQIMCLHMVMFTYTLSIDTAGVTFK